MAQLKTWSGPVAKSSGLRIADFLVMLLAAATRGSGSGGDHGRSRKEAIICAYSSGWRIEGACPPPLKT